jgi:2-(1,2-epoxy-1,2-dihydrophenyl)acetyl-CoA isomerase
MRTEFERAYVTAIGPVASVTLNHPEVLNAASPRLVGGLNAALKFVDRPENGFRAMVLTGEGRGFCSGANLRETPEDSSTGETDTMQSVYHPMLRRLREMRMPVVVAINGPCVGIGMSIALSGDILLAGRSAYFLQAFARVGLAPDGGSSWLLPRLIGLARAREMTLLAEKLPATKALEWGLINRVVDDGDLTKEVLGVAQQLAAGPTVALNLMRRLYQESPRNSYEDQLNLESQVQRIAVKSRDFLEGVAAFQDKRPPRFQGN